MRHTLRNFAARLITVVIIGAAVGAILVAVPALPAAVQPASAADAADWDPGYIIDDRIFYDSQSMSAAEVQAFLVSKLSACRSGYTCLKDYGQPTGNIAPDRYCAGYQAAGYQTAAQIIDIVARSCGINQRVLLVLLQKEQSLVTSTAPTQRQFDAATGQSCPDTAPCDPAFSGFFYQLYYAARQYEIYRLNPTSFGYQAGRWNNILYHPEPARGCGSARVYIQNQATAGLYIYTPYTPNASALANLYGTGDGCSSYGNRNFWRLFTDWFGDPQSYSTHPGFDWYWQARGAAGGVMGNPTSYLISVPENGGGYYQRFERAILYTSTLGTTAIVFNNEFGRAYAGLSGPAGPLGWPKSEQMCATDGACFQVFTGGTLTSSASAGIHVIWGGFSDYWVQSGGVYGSLGVALTDTEYVTGNALQGWTQRFQRATLNSSPLGLVVVPNGAVQRAWQAAGGAISGYGWPASDHRCVGASCAQSFQTGTLSSTSAWGTHAILWGFEAHWRRLGGLDTLGAALDDLRFSNSRGGGWMQQFATSAVVETSAGAITMPYDAIYGYWLSSGRENGALGWPVSSRACENGGCAVKFQDAIVTTQVGVGTNAIIGGFVGGWERAGGLGAVGVARVGLRYSSANGGGWLQEFSGGTITQSSSGVPVFTPNSPILSTWYYYGGEATWLGWPTSAPACTSSGCVQYFQYGVGRTDTAGTVSFTRT